jgi:3-hydroxypropanoate dehydrogenase
MNITTEQLFDDAHTYHGWKQDPVDDATLRRLWDMLKWGPTSANSQPLRILFVRDPAMKAQVARCMTATNVEKTRAAPVVAVLGMDMEFHEKLPQLFPHVDARSWFAGKPALIESTALRNSSIQGGYFIVAARALGLDCGPMSGFDAAQVDALLWAGTTVRTNFICNIGHGDPAKIKPRNARLTFEQACRVI